MIIQHNIMALNAHRQLSGNNGQVSKNLEKLSSGYRINRAGDDAAGLAISEKMRSQIKGLERAQSNAQDGISLVQTAEGALTEVHSMLNRLVDLGTESANGTIQATDRQKIQDEVDALTAEIDRISKATNFNGIKLLDGSLGGKGGSAAAAVGKFGNLTVTDTTAVKGSYTGIAISSAIASTEKDGSSVSYTVSYEEGGSKKTLDFSVTLGTDKDGNKVLVGGSGKEYAIDDFATAGATADDISAALASEIKSSALNDKFTITAGTSNGTAAAAFAFVAKSEGSAGAKVLGISESATVNAGTVVSKDQKLTVIAPKDVYQTAAAAEFTLYDGTGDVDDAVFTVNGQKFMYVKSGTDVSKLDKNINLVAAATVAAGGVDMASLISQKTGLTVDNVAGALTFKPGTSTSSSGGLTLQIGDTADDFNKVTVSVGDMSSKGLGITGLQVTDQGLSADAIDLVNEAVETVSTARGQLGALQNRLEHTINNLGVTTENMTAAESRIRDVDMAKEMMHFTKNNVLTQAAQAMLAQANQQPQQVLQLLR